MRQYLKRVIRKGMSKLVGTQDLADLLARVKQLTDTFDAAHSRMLLNEVAATNQAVQQLLSRAHQ